MPQLFGSNDETAVRWDLPRLLELDLLEEGEIMCEVEGATCAAHLGVLVVTDVKVLFVERGLIRRKWSYVKSIALEDIEKAEVYEPGWSLRRNPGALAISIRQLAPPGALDEVPAHRELGRFAELLEERETPTEVEEGVWLKWRLGTLLVTDRRVAFFMGGILWQHRCVVSVPFDGFLSVSVLDDEVGMAKLAVATDEALDSDHLEFKVTSRARAEEISSAILRQKQSWRTRDLRPVVPFSAQEEPSRFSRVEFEGILGGRERAEQIVRTILRQKAYLADRDLTLDSGQPDETEADGVQESADDMLPVSVGRGVSAWVNAHGGRLYVWGEPFSDALDSVKASIERPADVEFVPLRAITDFELYVEEGMSWSQGIHLGRRWFGLRSGIEVDTGLTLPGGF